MHKALSLAPLFRCVRIEALRIPVIGLISAFIVLAVIVAFIGLVKLAGSRSDALGGSDRACARADLGGVPAARIAALRRGFNLTGWVDHRLGANPRSPSPALLLELARL